MSLKKKFLKSKPVCKVTFSLPKEQAKEAGKVTVVGEFNDWDTAATPLRRQKDGSFRTTLDLEAGRDPVDVGARLGRRRRGPAGRHPHERVAVGREGVRHLAADERQHVGASPGHVARGLAAMRRHHQQRRPPSLF